MSRYGRSYRNDPHWITVKFGAPPCARCHSAIKPGSEAFYYPANRSMLCSGESCGAQDARDFAAARQDEDFMSSQFSTF